MGPTCSSPRGMHGYDTVTTSVTEVVSYRSSTINEQLQRSRVTVSATQATGFSHSKLFSSVLQWRLENRFEGEGTVRSVRSLAEARDGLLESMTGGVD